MKPLVLGISSVLLAFVFVMSVWSGGLLLTPIAIAVGLIAVIAWIRRASPRGAAAAVGGVLGAIVFLTGAVYWLWYLIN